MVKLVILGTGNVATHLFRAFFESKDVEVVQVYGRNVENLRVFKEKTEVTSSLDCLVEADVYLVCIKDDAIEEVVSKIPFKDNLIAHTSGSVPLLSIAKKNGVFYPLQTFSKNTKIDFSTVPLCLEASDKQSYQRLDFLAKCISKKRYKISTQQRKALHLSAVFVCNFTNYLYSVGEELCEENEVPYEILHSLILETAKKATQNSPSKVQTGPAIRNDEKTIATHLNNLKSEDFKEIYNLLTEKIRKENF